MISVRAPQHTSLCCISGLRRQDPSLMDYGRSICKSPAEMIAHTQTVEFEHSSVEKDDAKWTTEIHKQDPHSWIWCLQVHQPGTNVDDISIWPKSSVGVDDFKSHNQSFKAFCECGRSLTRLLWHTDKNGYLKAFRNITSGRQEGWRIKWIYCTYIVMKSFCSVFRIAVAINSYALNCYNKQF